MKTRLKQSMNGNGLNVDGRTFVPSANVAERIAIGPSGTGQALLTCFRPSARHPEPAERSRGLGDLADLRHAHLQRASRIISSAPIDATPSATRSGSTSSDRGRSRWCAYSQAA